MRKRSPHILLYCLSFCLVSCSVTERTEVDIIENSFPQAQAELRGVLETIYSDAMRGDAQALRDGHLYSAKFSKFGSRSLERIGIDETLELETKFVTSVSNLRIGIDDVKIDVFGDVAIATYYHHVTFDKDGEHVDRSGRQTLVFAKVDGTWKVVHEHVTSGDCFAD